MSGKWRVLQSSNVFSFIQSLSRMTIDTFKSAIRLAYERTEIAQCFDVIQSFFGEYGSYTQKDLIPLLAIKKRVNYEKGYHWDHDYQNDITQIEREFEQLVQKIIDEKQQILLCKYDEISANVNDIRNLITSAKISDIQKLDRNRTLFGLPYYQNLYASCLDKIDHIGELNPNTPYPRAPVHNLLKALNLIEIESEIIFKKQHQLLIQKDPLQMQWYQMIVDNKTELLFIEIFEGFTLSEALETTVISELLRIRFDLNEHKKEYFAGLLTDTQFAQKRNFHLNVLSTFLFHQIQSVKLDTRYRPFKRWKKK